MVFFVFCWKAWQNLFKKIDQKEQGKFVFLLPCLRMKLSHILAHLQEYPPTNNKASKKGPVPVRMISNDVTDNKEIKGSKEKVDAPRQASAIT